MRGAGPAKLRMRELFSLVGFTSQDVIITTPAKFTCDRLSSDSMSRRRCMILGTTGGRRHLLPRSYCRRVPRVKVTG